MRKSVGIVVGILIIACGILAFVFIKNRDSGDGTLTAASSSPRVPVQTAFLQSLPYLIEATGTLTAQEKVEIYSEVQGILQETIPPFRAGNTFQRSQVMLRINSEEYRAQVQSTKSSLVNQIAALLPDMEIEYPEAAKKWEAYLQKFDMEGALDPLPEFSSTAEKLFVTGKNIVQTYYNVKNQQERLAKYAVRAPFTGVVTESTVNVGTLVRSGQKLGEFIDPSRFELTLPVPADDKQYLAVGKEVKLTSVNENQTYAGTISRINPSVNQETQTIDVIVAVTGKDLSDGQYLKAHIEGEIIEGAYTINSALLVENDQVYVVEDSVLKLHPIKPINYQQERVVVLGLNEGQVLVKQSVPGAYPGMKVEPMNK